MRVFLDTAPLIYLTEGHSEQSEAVATQLSRWIENETVLGTSTLTLMELLVVPKREDNTHLVLKYKALLKDVLSLPLIALDEGVAEAAAAYRAGYGFKPPDAVQLASAVVHGYDVFYTNDRQLTHCPDIDVVLVTPADG